MPIKDLESTLSTKTSVAWRMYPSDQPLVPTSLRPSHRHATGTYDSSDRLPTTALLFERLLARIRSAHENRKFDPCPFPELWEKACKQLEKHGNATDYANWKVRNVLRNVKAFADLDDQIAEAWAGVQLSRIEGEGEYYRQVAYTKLKHLRLQRDTLKPKATINVDDALEIAIAFWIEARNAYNASDEARAIHALLEGNFYLGTTYSPITEAEAQRARGRKGIDTAPRDAIVAIAVEVISCYTVSRRITLADQLCAVIAEQIELDPKYSEAVSAYKNWNNKGSAAATSVSERMHNMLMALAKKKQGVRESSGFRKAFKELHERTKAYGLPDKTRKVKNPAGG